MSKKISNMDITFFSQLPKMICGLMIDRPLSNVQQIQRVLLAVTEAVVVDAADVTVVVDNPLVEIESLSVANVSYYCNPVTVCKIGFRTRKRRQRHNVRQKHPILS